MSSKNTTGLVLKVLVLTILFLIIFTISGALLAFDLPQPPEDKMNAALLGSILMAVVDTLVVTIIVTRSRWHGWQLALATGFSMFGVTTVMSQIETAYFGPALGIPASMLPGIILIFLATFIVFTPLAVLILGKWPASDDVDEPNERAVMPAGQWVVKLAAIAIIYCVLYFGFGFVVAWSNPELRAMYGEGVNQAVFSPYRLILFQVFRSALWVLFALPVIRGTRGPTWQVALIVGLLYALPMNIVHASPNPFMPDPSVRLSHFVETTTSNFIFGLIVTWLVHRRHSSLGDLFTPSPAGPGSR